MGNLINPVSFRLGITKFWNFNWALNNNINYSFLSTKNNLLKNYIDKIVNQLGLSIFKFGFLFTNLKTIEINNKLTFILYFKFNSILVALSYINKVTSTKIYKIFKNKIFFDIKTKVKIRGNKKQKIIFFKNKNYFNFNSKTKIINQNRLLNFYTAERIIDSNSKKYLFTFSNLFGLQKFSSYFKNKINLVSLISSELVKYILYKNIFKKLKLFLMYSVKNFWYNKNIYLNFLFSIYHWSAITAAMIARFVVIRLRQRFPARPLVKSLLRQMIRLQQVGTILGFKITCSGRFARRGRASFIWEDTGKIGNSVLDINVDYTLFLVTLVNSICGIKVWIVRNKQASKSLII